MKIGITGGTGFVGRYIVRRLVASGHDCRCWYRQGSDRSGFDDALQARPNAIEWIAGELQDADASSRLVDGCDAVVHAALYRQGTGFRGEEGDLLTFVDRNVLGSLRLIEAARAADVGRFVFVSTCAVHEQILDDRPLDETHPLWPLTHYGAHKAAIEKFVHSFGLGLGYSICALRPTGVYGQTRPIENSKWFDLVSDVVQGKTVDCQRGGKEVHAADVAKAVEVLLDSDQIAGNQIAGQAFSCYDRYISQHEVATLAKEMSDSTATIEGTVTTPKHQIATEKIRQLGMEFGGKQLLHDTVACLVKAAQNQ